MDYQISRDLFNKTFLKYVYEKAEQNKNTYLLSVFKTYGEELDILRHFSDKTRIKFIFSFLSCLDLHETLSFVDKIQDVQKQFSGNKSHYKYSYTLKKALIEKDVSFSFNYDSDVDKEDLIHSFQNIENDYSEDILRRCISSSNNLLSLHSWKIKMVFHVEDFLNYFSDRMLDHYCGNTYQRLKREDFYKKNINIAAVNEEYAFFLRKVYFEYMHAITEKYPEFSSCLKEVIISLSDYYHAFTEGSLRREVTLDLSEKNILLDQSLLEKEVVTL